jgi:hypothetical protein
VFEANPEISKANENETKRRLSVFRAVALEKQQSRSSNSSEIKIEITIIGRALFIIAPRNNKHRKNVLEQIPSTPKGSAAFG